MSIVYKNVEYEKIYFLENSLIEILHKNMSKPTDSCHPEGDSRVILNDEMETNDIGLIRRGYIHNEDSTDEQESSNQVNFSVIC